MPFKVAINGFGRIGRTFFKAALSRKEIEIAVINDLGDLENLAYLLKYDSVYGCYDKKVKTKGSSLFVAGKEHKVFSEKDPEKLPWKDLGIDVVVESTGFFTSDELSQKHLKAGAKKVVISAPAKGEGVEAILLGANEDKFKSTKKLITSNGSCTTNAVAPVMAVLVREPGIKKALLNTIHAYTSTQGLVDGPGGKEDLRRGRAAAQNIVPTSTGAAKTVGKVIPEINNVFDGIALRVPVICGSIADITFLAKRKTSVEEINKIFKKAAKEEKFKGILKVSEEPIVSSDIVGDDFASIVDLSMTRVVGEDLVKVLAWYDNEWAYSVSLVKHVIRVGESL